MNSDSTDTYRRFSPARIWAIAMSTVTQLLRMRIIVFLAVFCVLVVAAGFSFPVLDPEQQLKLLKDVSLGALQIFALIIAIVATALLLPRDVEDRTLYTILAKPVPRHEYLLGKLLGVLVVIAAGLIVMDGLFSFVLWNKQSMMIADNAAALMHQFRGKVPPGMLEQVNARLMAQGLTWSLHLAVWAIFLKASVLAAVALLISCFATSTLFTVISAFCVMILGHGEGLLREYFFTDGVTTWDRAMSALLAVAVPDLGLFDAVDAVVAGKVLSLTDISTMTGIGALYVVGYAVVAHLIFVEKEL
jgi:ABC-type Na+ efflux pump permease subunit